MKTNTQRVAGLLWLGSLCFWQPSLAQERTHPMAHKADRQRTSVAAKAPQAAVIRGAQHDNAPGAKSGRKAANPFATHLPAGRLTLRNDVPGLQVKRSAHSDLPIFISGAVSEARLSSPNGRLDLQKAAVSYLNGVKDVLRVRQPEAEFSVHRTEIDDPGQLHIRMKQSYRGVEVYGSEIILHAKSNQIQSLNGRYFPTPGLANVKPALSAEGAVAAATGNLRGKAAFAALSAEQKTLLGYEKPESKLVIYHVNDDPNNARLTWHVTLRPNFIDLWEYFVDANTGAVLHQYNHTCAIDGARTATAKDLSGATQTVHTYQMGTGYYFMDASRPMFNAAQTKLPENPVGVLLTFDARNTSSKNFKAYDIVNTNNVWNNPTAVSAHVNAGKIYEYFRTVHGRNAIDGQGGNIISFINVADEDGSGLDNAYWNGKAMFYGNGNVGFKPLAGSMDVAGHEMSHGINDKTANLEYQGQAGAMDESFADIFGAMNDLEDWKIGEDVVKTSVFPSGALRDLSDPHNGGSSLDDRGYQPRTMAEMYTGSEDNGGVHINSGIPNWAYYKFATAIGTQKAQKVYYKAISSYLSPKSQFIDLRLAVVQSATDLHGANSPEVNAAKAAFDAVGIYENGGGNGQDDPSDLPTNPGQDFILLHDASANDSDPNTWYVINTAGTDLKSRSRTTGINKPSVTDKGDFAYYVTAEHKLRAVSLTGAASESTVHDQPIWDNVAISKDGNRLAAVSIAADTSIYVYDFESEEWAKFVLYNPTNTEGITSGDVQFADALEWDYTGQYLLYDAYNTISKDGTSEAIDYWDVGLIKVWDNKTGKFGDGTVEKIFAGLPENVSVGNPSFSKNSPFIVAFDRFDAAKNEHSLIGADLEKGRVGTIATDIKTFGYPSYSKADDKMAYTTISAAGDTVINVLTLKADKISATTAAPTTIVKEGKWAVWYVQGERKVLSSAKDITDFRFGSVTPAANGTINGSAITVTVPPTADLKSLIATFKHSADATVKVGSKEQVSGATKNDFTNPVTYTVTAQDGTTKSYTVTVTKAVNTAVEDKNNISGKLTVFPNPTAGPIRVRLDEYAHKVATVELMNAAGAVLHGQQVQPQALEAGFTLDTNGLPAGMYYLRLTIGEKIAYKKVVVQ
jgi:Zn-dependent metalloprotease